MSTATFNALHAKSVLFDAQRAAEKATNDYITTYGDRDACGFAWVKVRGVRINSKMGKLLVLHGFDKAYGGGLSLWNPSRHFTQAMTAKEKGAEAYAKILRDNLGLDAFADSRMD